MSDAHETLPILTKNSIFTAWRSDAKAKLKAKGIFSYTQPLSPDAESAILIDTDARDNPLGISDPQPQPTTLLPTLPSSYHRPYTSLAMATPAVPQDLYSYCTLLRSELQRVHDRLDRLEFGDTAASTPRGHAWRFSWDGARWGSEPSTPAPTPAIIAVGHTAIPLAETLPTAQDAPSRYSCTLVVPDSVVGHIVGRGGKGLHQSHDISGAQLRAYTDKASPLERRVSIRGTDQQIGEALIALGKRFMRKRTLLAGCARFFSGSRTQESSYPASNSLPHNPAAISIPTQVMASPIPTPRPSSTPYAPSVAMPTAIPSPSPRSVAPSPMAIDAIRPERGRRQQTARRGGAVSASDSRIDSQGNLLFRGDPGF
ncbi:hypothetical protein R3P38DRAFT_3502190 [Favolaschia claudopus]|uniref:K Homology domain-containing protein n=1 Tax=Favolaschia claudopus TaxID=2862362 RepID=A0AAV9Z2Q6_9AGAR